jgi:hypothetical protein
VSGVQDIDSALHASRLAGPGIRRTYRARVADLPEGAMVEVDGAPWLVFGGGLLAWTPGGYRDRVPADAGSVTVITPRATVAVLAAGYRPVVHPSAGLNGDGQAVAGGFVAGGFLVAEHVGG